MCNLFSRSRFTLFKQGNNVRKELVSVFQENEVQNVFLKSAAMTCFFCCSIYSIRDNFSFAREVG